MFKNLKSSFNSSLKSVGLKQSLITEYYDLKSITIDKNNESINLVIDSAYKVYGYNENTGNWHCLDCGENMGDNPRQLCGKSYCYNL
jgi:hypothetical protein